MNPARKPSIKHIQFATKKMHDLIDRRLTLTECRKSVNELTNDKTKNFWAIGNEEKATQMLFETAMESLKLKILLQEVHEAAKEHLTKQESQEVVDLVGRDILKAQESRDYQKASDILRDKLKETLAEKRLKAGQSGQVTVLVQNIVPGSSMSSEPPSGEN